MDMKRTACWCLICGVTFFVVDPRHPDHPHTHDYREVPSAPLASAVVITTSSTT
jgi:hypothetical protein